MTSVHRTDSPAKTAATGKLQPKIIARMTCVSILCGGTGISPEYLYCAIEMSHDDRFPRRLVDLRSFLVTKPARNHPYFQETSLPTGSPGEPHEQSEVDSSHTRRAHRTIAAHGPTGIFWYMMYCRMKYLGYHNLCICRIRNAVEKQTQSITNSHCRAYDFNVPVGSYG